MKTVRPALCSRAVAALLLAPFTAIAGTRTWDGGGTGEHWASNLPWEGNNAPVAGDILVWPANQFAGSETDNDFPSGTSFREIKITSRQASFAGSTRDGWVHRGHTVALQEELRVTHEDPLSVTRIEFPITIVPVVVQELASVTVTV